MRLTSLLLIALLAHSALGWKSPWEEELNEARVRLNAFSAFINDAAGVFKKVYKAGEPIYKHVSGGTWGMRQISAHGKTYRTLYTPSIFGSAFSGLGKLAWWTAATVETVSVAEAVGKDLIQGEIKNTARASAKAVGSWTGAACGASAGAVALSFIPGVGTLVGGIAGGLIGAYAGSAVGEMAADVVVGAPENYRNPVLPYSNW